MTTKIAGGFDLGEGAVIGPMILNGADCVLLCPPVWAFDFGIGGILSNLEKLRAIKSDERELQHIFNSTLDDLISEILIYLENMLKIISIKNELSYRINSVQGAIKAYNGTIDFNLHSLSELAFLEELDRARGEKHHTNQRYSSHKNIGGESYNSLEKIEELTKLVHRKIKSIDTQLNNLYPIFIITKTKKANDLRVEWKTINHAIDTTSGAVIQKNPAHSGLSDMKHVTYFAVGVKFKI